MTQGLPSKHLLQQLSGKPLGLSHIQYHCSEEIWPRVSYSTLVHRTSGSRLKLTKQRMRGRCWCCANPPQLIYLAQDHSGVGWRHVLCKAWLFRFLSLDGTTAKHFELNCELFFLLFHWSQHTQSILAIEASADACFIWHGRWSNRTCPREMASEFDFFFESQCESENQFAHFQVLTRDGTLSSETSALGSGEH